MIELISSQNFFLLLCVSIIYLVGLSIFRLYLDPLAKFPGPKIAALTLWYEFYYDVIKRGKYTFEIERMHKRYGQSRTFPAMLERRLMAILRPNHKNQSVRAAYQRSGLL